MTRQNNDASSVDPSYLSLERGLNDIKLELRTQCHDETHSVVWSERQVHFPNHAADLNPESEETLQALGADWPSSCLATLLAFRAASRGKINPVAIMGGEEWGPRRQTLALVAAEEHLRGTGQWTHEVRTILRLPEIWRNVLAVDYFLSEYERRGGSGGFEPADLCERALAGTLDESRDTAKAVLASSWWLSLPDRPQISPTTEDLDALKVPLLWITGFSSFDDQHRLAEAITHQLPGDPFSQDEFDRHLTALNSTHLQTFLLRQGLVRESASGTSGPVYEASSA